MFCNVPQLHDVAIMQNIIYKFVYICKLYLNLTKQRI